MLQALSTLGNRKRTLILLVLCSLSAIAAAIVGISDNPPGIVLAYLSAFLFILAFVHPWKSAKPYRYLILASFLGFVITALLHNVFEAVAGTIEATPFFKGLFEFLGVFFFMLALLLCPPAFVVGIVGAMVARNRKQNRPVDTSASN
ncbi:MAG: hypothetical protein EHM72_06755 [Calditrichaeota bacterium]|nr:MAG: hypothetical protein EHM72_06755 [Calditrichota bacterium]